MDIRCGNCSKLFRVADEKIAGKGVRFKCTRCGETITVTKQDLEMDLLAREGGEEGPVVQPPPVAPPPPQPDAPPPPPQAEPEAREYVPPPPDPEESDAQDYKPQDTPAAGLENFDFSSPDVAAQHAQQEDAGMAGFAFGDQGGLDQAEAAGTGDDEAGEVSLSDEETQAADDAFTFPTEMISEPQRQPAFAAAAEAAAEPEEAGRESGEAAASPSSEGELDLSALGTQAPDLASEARSEEEPEQAPALPKTGPVFTPPPRQQTTPQPSAEEELDLAAALAMPRTGDDEGGSDTLPFEESGESSGFAGTEEEVHPLASGNKTGAVTGIIAAVPIVLLLYFSFKLVVAFLPFLSALPSMHLIAVAGAGTLSLGIMIGMVVAVLQARAGKKLFFLLNILIGALFGALLGCGITAVILFASKAPIELERLSTGAIYGAVPAFVLSLLLAIVRRIMVFTKEEAFSASLSGGQKAGLLVSLLIILASGYGLGTFPGAFGTAAGTAVKQRKGAPVRVPAPAPAPASSTAPASAPMNRPPAVNITPDGLEIVDAAAYVEKETGDLVITGTVGNTLDTPKNGWYLDVGVLDGARNRLATVVMVNGVQFLTKKDYGLLAKRNKDVATLKKQMLRAVRSGTIPPKGREPFELHLMEPPAGMTSILPVLKTFDPAATFDRFTAEMQRP